jgi:hypothetical protein
LSDPERTLLTSLVACILFGYAAVSSLVFYRRMRKRIGEYRERGYESPRRLDRMVQSPQYGLIIWVSGAIGVIGFVIASWELLWSLLAILRAG